MSNRAARRWPAMLVAVLAASLVALAGCASQPKARSTWQDGARRGQSYSSILVVGVSPNVSQRCAFERVLAKRLRSETVLVATSCDAMKPKEPLSRAGVESVVDELGIDAVIATLLVGRKLDAKDGGSRDTRGGAYYKATDAGWATGWDGYYGTYGVPVIYADFTTAPSITTIKAEIEISSRVFDTRSAQPVYTIDTTMKNIESRDQGFLEMTAAIADRLHKDGLLAK